MRVPFVPARWFTPTSGRPVDLLVIHSMEIPEKPDTAEGCAAYFARGERKASAHACVDSDSRVDCVRDQDVAYGAPGANHNGLHLELAGYAKQSRLQWLDPFGRAMIGGPAAEWVREKAGRWGIPLRSLSVADLRAGARGVTTHARVSQAWHKTDHTDPGPGFPLDVLLAAASATDEDDMALNPEERAELDEALRLVRNMHHHIVVPGTGLPSIEAKLDALAGALHRLAERLP